MEDANHFAAATTVVLAAANTFADQDEHGQVNHQQLLIPLL